MTTTVNYSDVQIERMTTIYTSADNDAERKEAVEEIATEFGKTVNSVRAKLAGLKIYIKPVKTTKANVVSATKATIVAEIAKSIDMTIDEAESLTKCTKKVLDIINGKLKAYEMNLLD